MEIEEEIKEFRKHTKNILVEGRTVKILTLEDIQIVVEFTISGVFVEFSSVFIDRKEFDDIAQLLTYVSSEYRDSFSNELISRLNNLESV